VHGLVSIMDILQAKVLELTLKTGSVGVGGIVAGVWDDVTVLVGFSLSAMLSQKQRKELKVKRFGRSARKMPGSRSYVNTDGQHLL
jgi:hypothetical protein